jgi:hypothetical protein
VSARIAYLSRADRGARLTGVRLLGPHGDEAWDPAPSGETDPVAASLASARGAGHWIAQRLSERKGASLAAVCLDVDGAACAWVATPTTDPSAIAAIARQGPIADELVPGASSAETPLNFFAQTAQDSQVQGLVAPAQPRKKGATAADRVGVLAVGDIAARLLVDELDRAGVPVDQITTLYHMMADAWDPSAARASATPSAGEVVSDAAPTTGVVLVEPHGRLVWAWSRRGMLLAGGSLRLAMIRGEAPAPVDEAGFSPAVPSPRLAVTESDIARLSADWLAWSVQLGVAPDRVICLLPQDATQIETDHGLEPTVRLLSKRWGDITIDAAVYEDPVGATLLRVIAKEQDRGTLAGDPRAGLTLLSHRPTRAHQRLYMWAAGAVMLVALALGIGAWRIHAAAATSRVAAAEFKRKIEALVQEVHPPARISPLGVSMALRQELSKLQKEFAPPDKPDPTQPILEELDALSSVLGVPDIELTEITLTNTAVSVKVVTPDLPTAELVLEALRNVGGSHVSTWTQQFAQAPNQKESTKVNATFTGLWAPIEKPRASGGVP